jgi:hypothetical protein
MIASKRAAKVTLRSYLVQQAGHRADIEQQVIGFSKTQHAAL